MQGEWAGFLPRAAQQLITLSTGCGLVVLPQGRQRTVAQASLLLACLGAQGSCFPEVLVGSEVLVCRVFWMAGRPHWQGACVCSSRIGKFFRPPRVLRAVFTRFGEARWGRGSWGRLCDTAGREGTFATHRTSGCG